MSLRSIQVAATIHICHGPLECCWSNQGTDLCICLTFRVIEPLQFTYAMVSWNVVDPRYRPICPYLSVWAVERAAARSFLSPSNGVISGLHKKGESYLFHYSLNPPFCFRFFCSLMSVRFDTLVAIFHAVSPAQILWSKCSIGVCIISEKVIYLVILGAGNLFILSKCAGVVHAMVRKVYCHRHVSTHQNICAYRNFVILRHAQICYCRRFPSVFSEIFC
jgi:hypothetical protein